MAGALDFYYVDRRTEVSTCFEEFNLKNQFFHSNWRPGKARILAFLNINSYGGGMDVYRGDKGKQRPHDGLLEVCTTRASPLIAISHFLGATGYHSAGLGENLGHRFGCLLLHH